MTGKLPFAWSVIVVGARVSGSAAAWALAPYVDSVLLLDHSTATAFWPQPASWDRNANLLWDDLGLLGDVHGCGAPPVLGHTFQTLDTVVRYSYPADDEHCYRMTVPRERLDPSLAQAAVRRGNVTLARPAKVTGVLREGDRVTGVDFILEGARRQARCGLLVLADGRVSRNADRLGAPPYMSNPSPWSSFVYYAGGLGLPPDHGYYSRQPGAMTVVLPCGPAQWCVSASIHAEQIARGGTAPVRVFTDTVRADPLVGAAVARGSRLSRAGGAGKLRMLRRPMAGPGWALVGDCGYFLDPLTALGVRAALVTVRLLRDRVADAGGVLTPGLHAGLTAARDSLLRAEWERTVLMTGSHAVPPGQCERARVQARDPAAALAAVRSQMGLPPSGPAHASSFARQQAKEENR